MHERRNTIWLVVASLPALALAPLGCGKDEAKKPAALAKASPDAASADEKPTPTTSAESAAPKTPAPLSDAKAIAEEFGVQPGGIEHARSEGPDAILTKVEGNVQLRRVGEEDFVPAKAESSIFAGDQIRTDASSSATLTLVDNTVVQLAADSAIALGDRDATPDPASSAAVLFGAARFSVSPRMPGEGTFLVFTPGAIVSSKGNVFAMGVAADGDARVGVESGELLLAGVKQLDKPVSIGGGKAAEISVAGEIATPTDFKSDDWADWRVQAEGDLSASAVAKAHLDALGNLETELDDAYADLATLSEAAINADAQAQLQLKAKDSTGYAKAAPEYGAAIEASYLAALRLEELTFATQSHAYAAEELYVRHPDEVQAVFAPVEARVHGAILLNKKFRVVINQRMHPLRLAFYAHHPEGRLHAGFVGYVVPSFFAKIKLRAVPSASVHALVHGPVFVPPRVVVKGKVERKVFIGIPELSWRKKLTVKAPPFRAGAGWAVGGGGAAAMGKLMVGLKATVPRVSVFGKVKLAPLAALKISVRGEPIAAAAHIRLKLKGSAAAAQGAEEDVAGGVSGGLEAGAKLKGKGAKVVERGAGTVKGGIKAGASFKGSVGVKVNVPKPPPPPKVKVEGGIKVKAKGGIKIGR